MLPTAVYRDCTFERIGFKGLGGLSMDRGRFENCTFVNCRWRDTSLTRPI
jgi:hypothetical protein